MELSGRGRVYPGMYFKGLGHIEKMFKHHALVRMDNGQRRSISYVDMALKGYIRLEELKGQYKR